ncbi:hypothetical protein GJ496_000726 [Pomphorhynchus laevis]|nr:hypothetical protein GJ496_000726 [Pomphorhynchus laevis]
MSLADELLADLEELDESDQTSNALNNKVSDIVSEDLKHTRPLKDVAKLLDSDKLQTLISDIKNEENSDCSSINLVAMIEHHPVYKLVVRASNLTTEITTEMEIIHKYICDLYRTRFPELESLVLDPLGYILTAKTLGNDVDKAKNCDDLLNFLNQATIMVVSVSASATQGTELSTEQLQVIDDAYQTAIMLNNHQEYMFKFIESRMTFIAPNLTALLGASVAAKIIGVAGGLTNLSKMPACNLLVLGSSKKFATGGMFTSSRFTYFASATAASNPDKNKIANSFASSGIASSTGFISRSDLVKDSPVDLRAKIARLVACKCSLAARVDICHSYPDGSRGQQFRNQILQKIEKLEEPPPVKQVKPLIPPIDPIGQRRGGRRARKMKERLGLTEVRKQANRMTFGEIEQDAYQEDLGLSLGQIGKSGSGRVRSAQIDAKTKVRISQKLQKTLQRDRHSYGGQTTTARKQISGTASTVAFTPLQGLEIVSAAAIDQSTDKAPSENAIKYFSSRAGFVKVSSVIPDNI